MTIRQTLTGVSNDFNATLTRHNCPEGQYNQLASIIFNSNENTIHNLFNVGNPELLNLMSIFIFFLFYTFGAAYTAGCGLSSGMFVPMIVVGSAYVVALLSFPHSIHSVTDNPIILFSDHPHPIVLISSSSHLFLHRYGRIVGLGIYYIYGHVDPGIYAVMGAAAFMAGVSRLTVSLTVIIIEITDDLANLLPIMLVVMTAKIVADFVIHPLFDQQITMKHIPYLEPNPVKEMKILMCKHIMAKHPNCLVEKDTIGNILAVCCKEEKWKGAFREIMERKINVVFRC